jgi:hypothetical protein
LASAIFIYKDHGDCGQDYPDSVNIDTTPSDVSNHFEVYGFIKPDYMALISDIRHENPAALEAWQSYVNAHQAQWLEEWIGDGDAKDIQDPENQSLIAKVKNNPIVLKVEQPDEKGYIFVTTTALMSGDQRFYWDGQHFYRLSGLDYPMCGS